MRRRDFIRGIGGTAAAWPLTAQAQQRERMRRIGVLMPFTAQDREAQERNVVFERTLHQLGWTVGQNLLVDVRSVTVAPVQHATRAIPIVMVNVADPVGAGFVQSLSRPGGNITGFTNFEYSMSGKWVETLKQIAPRVTRAGVLRDPTAAAGIGQFSAIQTVAQSLRVELTPLSPVGLRHTDELERDVAAFARLPNGGLIVTAGGTVHLREFMITLAARYRLPAVYPFRYYAADGGLITYGPDTHDLIRRAAGYVDRILKGEKPADLPVQAPTKYELVINLKTARALGLTVPDTLLARADEVIE